MEIVTTLYAFFSLSRTRHHDRKTCARNRPQPNTEKRHFFTRRFESHSIAISHYLAIMEVAPKGTAGWGQIIWNEEPGGNVEHIEEHGLTIEDVEHVLANPESTAESISSGLPCLFGHTPGDIYIIVVYEEIDEDTVYPVTSYEVAEP